MSGKGWMCWVGVVMWTVCMWAAAEDETTFTYQGRLMEGGEPAQGAVDVEFRLFDSATGGNQVGPLLAVNDLVFDDGLFTVDLDFGEGVFDGTERWLEITVNGAVLDPRQPIRPAPYAHFALDGLKPDSSFEADGDYATISGGLNNEAGSEGATVGGGEGNTATGLGYETVGGGQDNEAGWSHATVAGGNENNASSARTFIGGGTRNSAERNHALVAGGRDNTSAGNFAAILGGSDNAASGQLATIGGGRDNTASGDRSVIGGGGYQGSFIDDPDDGNIAAGMASTVPGGASNDAGGDWSLAAGRGAKIDAGHHGAFLWSDSLGDTDDSALPFESQEENEFAVRATGGVRLITSVTATGVPNAGVKLEEGESSWGSISDRNAKMAIEPAGGRGVLARIVDMPISEFSYKAQDESIRHMGPMAQDFHRLFGLGSNERRITPMNLAGISLAAIQGLHEVIEEQEQTIAAQAAEMEALEARLDAIEEQQTGRFGFAGMTGGLIIAGLALGFVYRQSGMPRQGSSS